MRKPYAGKNVANADTNLVFTHSPEVLAADSQCELVVAIV